MRIAIVGSGISGLVAAYRLCREHEVVVFEANNRIGGHTHTIDVDGPDQRWSIDTGFIVFNEENYQGFCGLLEALGVASQPTEMSFSVHDERTGQEWCGRGLRGLFAQKSNLLRPKFYGMIQDMLRFNREAADVLATQERVTVRDWLKGRNYKQTFIENFLVPMGSALWSAPPTTFLDFDMRFVVRFFAHHRMLQIGNRPVWRTVVGGSRTYLEPLTRPFREKIRLATPVRSVQRSLGAVQVFTESEEPEVFDEVILACHSDQALWLLERPSALETDILGKIPFQPNEVVLHTDTSVLPKRRSAWAGWNYRVADDEVGQSQVSYCMNILQNLRAQETYCVSLNQSARIDESKIIRRLNYSHPLFSCEAEDARARHPELIRHQGISFCGAYWGFGFHEDGLQSAERVAMAFAGGDLGS